MKRLEDIIEEVESLPVEQQTEVFDFISFLKTKHASKRKNLGLQTPEQIEHFFQGFKVDISGYKFDREQANARAIEF